MTVLEIAGGFAVGFLTGIGAALLYLRWKMKKQLGSLQQQMDTMMDATEGLEEMVPEPEDE